MTKIRLFEMFAGYSGASWALKKAGIEFECVGISEIDKFAIQCSQQNFPNVKNFGDCTKINTSELPDFDLLTGGFPCQDVSIAGKRDLTKGRTNLYQEILRIASAKKPKWMLLENVAGLLSMERESRNLINIIVADLKKIGYQVCWKLLNSKDFGIPQSRARVWIVCFRDDIYIPFKFQYPEGEKLNIFIKDILEEQVDSKYYLSEKLQERFKKYLEEKNRIVNLQPRQGKGQGGKGIISKNDGTTYCLDSGNCQAIVAMRGREEGQELEQRQDGCSNALTSVQKDNLVHIGNVQITCQKRANDTPKEINQFLKDGKKYRTISELAILLELPKTQVEHYFRTDESRAIPSPEIWLKLKKILNFSDKYDKQVTEIYEKEVSFEQTRRVYGSEGISPTLNTIQEPTIFDSRKYKGETNAPIVQGNVYPKKGQNGNIYDKEGLSPTLRSGQGIVGNGIGINNSPIIYDRKGFDSRDKFRESELSPTGQLRRLTPKECFRLMGFFNDEINLQGISDTQAYKLAGNGWALRPAADILKRMLL